MKRLFLSVLLAFAFVCNVRADEPAVSGPRVFADLPYKAGDALSDYEKSRCKLDLYLPSSAQGFASVVWLYGGGITDGDKRYAPNPQIARALADDGIAVAVVNYRHSPKAKYPAYIEDAAAAFVWVKNHIAGYGGSPDRVFVSGHSAGGYLAAMLVMDRRYLQALESSDAAVAGLIPISGQMITHSTVRQERGVPRTTVVVDEAAPVFHARKDAPPILALFADGDNPMRAEENLLFVAALKAAGNRSVSALEIKGRNHTTIAGRLADRDDPARQAIVSFIWSTPIGARKQAR